MRKVFISIVSLLIFVGLVLGTSSEAASKKLNLTISKGVTYYGEISNGKPHGQGTMKWGDTKTYSGGWINGKRSGYGKFVVTDMSEAYPEDENLWDNVRTITYKGYWKNDQKNGNGILINHVDAHHSGNQEDSIQSGVFKNNLFVSGSELSSSSNNYYGFSVKMNNKEVKAQTSRDELNNAVYYTGEPNYFDMDFLETVMIGATPNVEFIEKDSKGNTIKVQYSYIQENEHGAFSIRKERYLNDKLVLEVTSDAEVENGNFLNEIAVKLKPYNNEFNKLFKLYKDQWE